MATFHGDAAGHEVRLLTECLQGFFSEKRGRELSSLNSVPEYLPPEPEPVVCQLYMTETDDP